MCQPSEISRRCARASARARRRNRFRATAPFTAFCPITKARRLGMPERRGAPCTYNTTGPSVKRLPENNAGENSFLVSRCCLGSIIKEKGRAVRQKQRVVSGRKKLTPRRVAVPSDADYAAPASLPAFLIVLRNRACAFFSFGGADR